MVISLYQRSSFFFYVPLFSLIKFSHNYFTLTNIIAHRLQGNPYNVQYINKYLRKVRIPNKHISSHIFRHTHISMLAEKGVELKAIMNCVGHNDPNTMLSIYTHVTEAMQEKMQAVLESLSV